MGADLEFLQWLDEPARARDLVDLAGRHASNVTRALHRLEDRGLVTTWRQGKNLMAARSGVAGTMAARLFDAYPRLPWNELLTDRHIDLIAFFSSPADDHLRAQLPAAVAEERPRPYVPKTVKAAARWTGLSPSHTHRLVRDLADKIILTKTEAGYVLAPEHTLLREVAKLLSVQRAVQAIRCLSPHAYPLWQLGPVAIYQASGAEQANGPRGGLSLLPDFGLQVLEIKPTHLLAPWEPGPSDAILQTYLQGPTSTLNVCLACLLYHVTRPEEFLDRAQTYGIPVAGRLIKAYAENPGTHRGGGFPPAAEYNDIARQYGVRL